MTRPAPISYYVDAGLRTAANALPRRGFAALRRPVRRPLDEGVIEFAGEVILARDARPERDPGSDPAGGGRVGHHRAADVGVDAESAGRLRARTAHAVAAPGAQGPAGDARRRSAARWPPSRRWTEPGCGAGCFRNGARCATCRRATSCTSGRSTVTSSKPSRGQAHSPPGCRDPTCWCSGALLHDIGKGRGGDHSVIGAELATQIGTRLGLWPSDVDAAVQDGALPPAAARHRDPPRPAGPEDHRRASSTRSAATRCCWSCCTRWPKPTRWPPGPGVWGDWKASLIGDLVRRCRLVMAGEPLPQPDPIDPRHLSLAADGRRARRADARRTARTSTTSP